MSEIDELETRLRQAAGLGPHKDPRAPHRKHSRSFVAALGGCGARVQLDHIDDRPAGGVTLMLHSLSHDAAEAVLRFLSGRNEPNGWGSSGVG